MRFESCERRELLTGVLWSAADLAADVEAEAGGSCSAVVKVQEVRVTYAAQPTIAVVFSADMELADQLADGSIVEAFELFSYATGPVVLEATQFSYDSGTRTLQWTASAPLDMGYYELRLDGAQLSACGGTLLQGGVGGLQFAIPELAAAQMVQAAGVDLQVNGYSVPSLADWNSDQLLDLIVGEETSSGAGKVRVYLNQGTATVPVFDGFFYVQAGGADLRVPGGGCLGVFPRVADWDGDGRKDLLLGRSDGTLEVLQNIGTDAVPVFGSSVPIQVGAPGAKTPLQLGARATAALADWNQDGRLDLVTGALDGQVRVYLDQATSGTPDYRSALVVQDGNVALDDEAGRASVAVIDLDRDGRQDLVLGNTAGQIRCYRNVGSHAAPAFAGSALITASGVEIDLPGSPRSRPFVGDFNADGLPDLLVGAEDGKVRLYLAATWPSPTGDHRQTGAPGEGYTFRFALSAPSWHNASRPLDVNDDGAITALDVMGIFDELNRPVYHNPLGVLHMALRAGATPFYCDVTGDGFLTPLDCLRIINHLNAPRGEGEASEEPAGLQWHPAREAAGSPSDRDVARDTVPLLEAVPQFDPTAGPRAITRRRSARAAGVEEATDGPWLLVDDDGKWSGL